MQKLITVINWLAGKLIWSLKSITIVLRMAWYLFPAVFFLMATYACFWTLSQGKDVLISAIEKQGANWIVLLSLIFWVLITWYTGRILIYHKLDLYNSSKTIAFHAPRMLGFLGFSIVWLAFLQLPRLPEQNFTWQVSGATANWILWAGTPILYMFLYRFFKRLRVYYFWNVKRKLAPGISFAEMEIARAIAYNKIFWVLRVLLGLIFVVNIIWDSAVLLLISMMFLQLMYLFAVIWRRGALLFEKTPAFYDDKKTWAETEGIHWKQANWFTRSWYTILFYANISKKERGFFTFFNFISAIGLYCYLRAIVVMSFANKTGTLPFILLAFAVLVGFFALVSTISIINKINFHIMLLALVLLLSVNREPHYARKFTAPTTGRLRQRPTIKDYFLKWATERKQEIAARDGYPIFFVLSDGGASRSGYWTAAALGRMEDETGGTFSHHIFCLSGTSGGGVGVGTFFALLNEKQGMKGRSYEKSAKDFLQNDFLTYTLTRMLGPDFFRPLLLTDFLLKKVTDRAGALEKSMETGMNDSVFLKNKMANPFSAYIPNIYDTLPLMPVLCINTTRMQDGRPGVITNINIDSNKEVFNKRVDVINLLEPGADMHLSTVVIMGARFPYMSPAGRIDQHFVKKDNSNGNDSVKAHYFVDGGYFDNSGAGVVNEMIIEIKRLTDSIGAVSGDSSFAFLKKLNFYVIHATNSPIGDAVVEKVPFLKNDLMAPLLTIVGAYGTQTDINNLRLRRYLQGIYHTADHYRNVDLYNNISRDTLNFPMNWTISNFYQRRMNMQLDTSRQVRNFLTWLKTTVH
jgi:predicted acylesterase/phospholipase RssA